MADMTSDYARNLRWGAARDRLREACLALREPMEDLGRATRTQNPSKFKLAAIKIEEGWRAFRDACHAFEDESDDLLTLSETWTADRLADYRRCRVELDETAAELRTARIELDRWEALFRTIDPAAYETNVVMWSVLCGGAFGLGVLVTMWMLT